jgi:ABC-type iron transport system FetAB ATPase subunit
MVTGYRGSLYQLSHFISTCLHHLFKEKAFQGMVETQGEGNLDDIKIVLPNKIKAYQVKNFQYPIELDSLWNKKEASKNAKMHLGKFFDGWLSLKEHAGQKNIIPYLLTNTSLSEEFMDFLEFTKEEEGKKQLKFQESFVDESKKVFFLWQKDEPLKKVCKNFLEGEDVSNGLSTKIWEALKVKGFFNDDQFPTETLIKCVDKRDYGLDKHSFSVLKGKAHGSLQLQNVVQKLIEIKNQCGKDIGLFEHFFRQACGYLSKKNLHTSFLVKGEMEKRLEFKNFLKAFRFNINRETQENLDKRIRVLLKNKYPNCSSLLYPHIKFEIESWFVQRRHFYERQGELTPIINNQWFEEILKKADVCSQEIDKLFNYGKGILEKVQTTVQGLNISRTSLLNEIDLSIAPEQIVLIVGSKGIGKSALVKEYLKQNLHPWFAFQGEHLSSYSSLEAFLKAHQLSLDIKILHRFEANEKKILYIDSIEEISKKRGAFLQLINLFRKEKWSIILSTNNNQMDWLKENIEGLTEQEINVIDIPLLDEETDSNPLDPFIKKYPILAQIRGEKLFQAAYNDLFLHPLYLKFFCEEMAQLKNPHNNFDSKEILKKFEIKIWKKVVRNEGNIKGRISELRERLIIDLAINQMLGLSLSPILRTDDSKKLEALNLLKKDRLINENGTLANEVFLDLCLKMYFFEMIEEWLQGQELQKISDHNLGKTVKFDFIFTEFLALWSINAKMQNIDPLIDFLKDNIIQYEALAACFFHHLLGVKKKAEVEKMLNAIPILANLPVFKDGHRIRFPINIAIQSLDYELIQLLIHHGAQLCSSENSSKPEETLKRPQNLTNVIYQGNSYHCFIPLREAFQATCPEHSKERFELLNFLISKGAKLEDPVDFYRPFQSFLHDVVQMNDVEGVDFLLKHNVFLGGHNQLFMQTPLGIALNNFFEISEKIEKGHSEFQIYLKQAEKIIMMLVKEGARETGLLRFDALPLLVRNRCYDLAQFLLENGFSPVDCIVYNVSEENFGETEEINAMQFAIDNCDDNDLAIWSKSIEENGFTISDLSFYKQKDDIQFLNYLANKYPECFFNSIDSQF